MISLFNRYSVPRWMVFLADNVAVYATFALAYILRLNFDFGMLNPEFVLIQGLVVFVVYSFYSVVFRSYSGLLRHTTLTDISLVFMVTSFSVVSLVFLSIVTRLISLPSLFNLPLSVLLIHYVSITVILFFVRVFVKILFRFATMSGGVIKKVLIYGAGEMGFIVKRVLLSDPRSGFEVAAFIDDNRKLQGKKINGLSVYDSSVLNHKFLEKYEINTLIIAIKNLRPGRKSEIIRTSIDLGLEILETPAFDLWLNGQLNVRQLRKVKLEDLLGRDPIKLNMELIGAGLKDKVILVTGAAGSIGSEIVRQLARFDVKLAVLVDQAETPSYNLNNELNKRFPKFPYKLILGDVTNADKMKSIFDSYTPEIVFHAAAYKHVPLMEANPHEAVRVNVGGTRLLTDLAVSSGVSKFVMISSDKSVNPANVMGATKRVCEMIVQSVAQQEGVKTDFVITRFGNVLGSNGSVIPLFEKQISEGGPVTVTDPLITRYFMTISEACELVLEAGFMGKGNQIYVFDMGEPVAIVDLAYQMIRLSGLVPDKDIEVVFTGLRPGEKLYEELLTGGENILPTYHPKIKIAGVEKFDGLVIMSKTDSLLKDLYNATGQEIVSAMRDLVPEFVCMDNVVSEAE